MENPGIAAGGPSALLIPQGRASGQRQGTGAMAALEDAGGAEAAFANVLSQLAAGGSARDAGAVAAGEAGTFAGLIAPGNGDAAPDTAFQNAAPDSRQLASLLALLRAETAAGTQDGAGNAVPADMNAAAASRSADIVAGILNGRTAGTANGQQDGAAGYAAFPSSQAAAGNPPASSAFPSTALPTERNAGARTVPASTGAGEQPRPGELSAPASTGSVTGTRSAMTPAGAYTAGARPVKPGTPASAGPAPRNLNALEARGDPQTLALAGETPQRATEEAPEPAESTAPLSQQDGASAIMPQALPWAFVPAAALSAAPGNQQPEDAPPPGLSQPDVQSAIETPGRRADTKVTVVHQETHFAPVRTGAPAALAAAGAGNSPPSAGDAKERAADIAPSGQSEAATALQPETAAPLQPDAVPSAQNGGIVQTAASAQTPQLPSPVLQISSRLAAELAGTGAAQKSEAPSGGSEQTGAVKTLIIRLEPEELGTLTIRMSLRDEGLELHVEASRRETARLIENDQKTLSHLLQSAGYRVDTLAVQAADGPRASMTQAAAAYQDTSQSSGQFSGQQPSSQTEGQSSGSPRQQERGESAQQQAQRRNPHDDPNAKRFSGDVYV